MWARLSEADIADAELKCQDNAFELPKANKEFVKKIPVVIFFFFCLKEVIGTKNFHFVLIYLLYMDKNGRR